MNSNWLIGGTDHLELTEEYLQRYWPELPYKKIIVCQNSQYDFEYSDLSDLIKKGDSAFVSFDSRFGNFKRTELMHFVASRGIKLLNIISPRAMIAHDVKIGVNVFIGDGCLIGPGARIDYNSVILPGAYIGSKSYINSSNWIESGVHIGNNVIIGSNSKVCTGAIISDNIKIGKNCELGWKKYYDMDVLPGTFYDSKFDSPILTYY
jgi:UDP-3-O-[3-hydroxymyristoyl] glucosamine N-acyltransferase